MRVVKCWHVYDVHSGNTAMPMQSLPLALGKISTERRRKVDQFHSNLIRSQSPEVVTTLPAIVTQNNLTSIR